MAFVEYQYIKLSNFASIGWGAPLINERLSRTGAWYCLCD